MRAVAVIAILSGITAQAQSFEVASIRANHSGERIQLFNLARGGRFTTTNCSLRILIPYAYEVFQFQLSGAPDWVTSDKYDMAAKADGDPLPDEMRVLVRRLLEDRFQLKYHWETKESAGYNLVVSKPGKLREAAPGDCPGAFPDAPCGALRNTPGHTQGNQLTAGQLAGSLSFFIQAFVTDKTNLTGQYDIELQWTPERVRMQSAEPTGPSIFTALQEQLGLKLEAAKGPVKVLVIDHIERPSEN
jgi:uncharacterized protein (TIGR03435 family)